MKGNYLYNGKTFDEFVTAFAEGAKLWGHPFFLRFDWEMNGWWQFPWGTALNPVTGRAINNNTPQDYISMWKHVHDIFAKVGANNVTWVWCPNISGGNQTVPMSNLYPGDNYVDWTCMDGYNKDLTMVTFSDGHKEMKYWLTFDQVFSGSAYNGNKNSYKEITTLAPSKPIILGEWASDESGDGGTKKANWITNALNNLKTNYPQIRGVVWFNWNSDQGSSYVIESSSQSQQAFAKGISDTYFAGNVFQNISSSKIPGWINGSSQPSPTPNSTYIKIIQPLPNSIVANNTEVSIQAVGSSDITKIEMYANNNMFCFKTSSYVYTCNWKVPAGKNISYTLTVKAYSKTGTIVISTPITVVSN